MFCFTKMCDRLIIYLSSSQSKNWILFIKFIFIFELFYITNKYIDNNIHFIINLVQLIFIVKLILQMFLYFLLKPEIF